MHATVKELTVSGSAEEFKVITRMLHVQMNTSSTTLEQRSSVQSFIMQVDRIIYGNQHEAEEVNQSNFQAGGKVTQRIP